MEKLKVDEEKNNVYDNVFGCDDDFDDDDGLIANEDGNGHDHDYNKDDFEEDEEIEEEIEDKENDEDE